MNTTACSEVADYVWLTGDEAGAMLVELADDKTPLHTLVAKLRGRVSAARTHLLLEQVELRRRATAKFAHPDQMYFTRIGLEQATDEWVSAYKAARFAPQRAGMSLSNSPGAIADLCCGIGGDLLALTKEFPSVIGVDLDPIAAHFAAVNSDASVESTDVDQFDFKDTSALHIDPDRRPNGNRTTSLDYCQPNLVTIERLITRVPNAAVKLAPATQVPADWADRCELEWISRDRECRQLVAWHGALAQSPGQRRATIVQAARGLAQRTIIGQPNQPVPVVQQPGRYVFDIDPAVLAAHLKGVLAAEQDLSALDRGQTYLTGPRPIDDAALACFEIDEILPLETRKLARLLAERGIGQLEIKKRGVDIEPEKLRRELKLRGDSAATLLVAQVSGRSVAILAHRLAE
jgi:hypothetical protein